MAENTICNLIEHCHDDRWKGGCSFQYNLEFIYNQLLTTVVNFFK
jgi:hypothetical protein